MSHESRLVSLQDRHATLEHQLHEEFKRPAPDSYLISELKKQKLALKEEMARLV